MKFQNHFLQVVWSIFLFLLFLSLIFYFFSRFYETIVTIIFWFWNYMFYFPNLLCSQINQIKFQIEIK